MARKYSARLTGLELRVVHEVVLSLVTNDPDWQEYATFTDREWDGLLKAHETIVDALRTAKRAESTPAGDQ